jgi:hypothetical protein
LLLKLVVAPLPFPLFLLELLPVGGFPKNLVLFALTVFEVSLLLVTIRSVIDSDVGGCSNSGMNKVPSSRSALKPFHNIIIMANSPFI